jgi:hypothetical protein
MKNDSILFELFVDTSLMIAKLKLWTVTVMSLQLVHIYNHDLVL